VTHGADVPVGARRKVVEAGETARPGPVAGFVRADRGRGAGRAERLELAGRRAAVAGELVAVVTILTRVEDAVAADVDLLAGDDEEGRLHPTRGKERSLDLEDVGAAGAPGDGVWREPITDESGRRRGQGRVPLEEGGADPAARRHRAEEAGGGDAVVEGHVDGAQVVRHQRLHPVG